MILTILFRDDHTPKKLNLFTEKTFLADEKMQINNEAAILLRQKQMGYEKRKYTVMTKER